MLFTRTTFPAVSLLVLAALSSGCASTAPTGPTAARSSPSPTCAASAATLHAVDVDVQPTKDGEAPIHLREILIDATPDPRTLAAVRRLASVEALTGRAIDA